VLSRKREIDPLRFKMANYIAERHLLFSEKGGSAIRNLWVRVSAPSPIDQETVKFPVDDDMAVCHVEFNGLDEYSFDVYGMDSLQAVNMASNIDAVLERLGKKYDFYWSSGEPYFDDDNTGPEK
jgi:hypothetical protein